jgi:biopolymer transport protein ExbD
MTFVIDMTPLVDITFLLLTFLMFTAKFKSESESEQQFTIIRPQVTADTSKMPDKDLAVINIAVDDKNPLDTSFYYGLTNQNDWTAIKGFLTDVPPGLMEKNLVKVRDTTLLKKLIGATLRVRPTTKFALDADKRVSFKWIENAMNSLRYEKAYVFNFVTEKRKKS